MLAKKNSHKTLLLVLLLLAIETWENFSAVSLYFPRSGFFKLIFNWPLLKLLLPCGLFLFALLFLIYYFVFYYFFFIINLVNERYNWPFIKNKLLKKTFVFFTYYFAFTFIYGLNSFLFFNSALNHSFIYLYLFPYKSSFIFLAVLTAYIVYLIILALRLSQKKEALKVISFPLILIGIILSENWLGRIKPEKFTTAGNIIILGVDSLQYNRLSPKWGFEKELAPCISSFLEEGTVFLNAWSCFARTYPSYLSILTGRYPIHHGIRENILTDDFLDSKNVYLGEILKKNGFFCSHYTDETRFSIIRNIHGFDYLFHPVFGALNYFYATFFDYALTNLFLFTHTGNRLLYPLAYNRAHPAYNPKVFSIRSLRQINKLPRDKKQFIVIHLCANHFPYFYPFPYNKRSDLANPNERCIAMADDQVKMFLDFFKKSGLLDNSLVILLSDHGDGWDAIQQIITHGSDFECLWSNKMILAIRGKGIPKKKVLGLVRSIDIYPTILEWAGIPFSDSIDGKSLMEFIHSNEETSSRKLFAETGFDLSQKYQMGKLINHIENEARNYIVDYRSGLVHIKKEDYYEHVFKKKWYLLLDENRAVILNPFYQKKECIAIDPLHPEKRKNIAEEDGVSCEQMFQLLKEFYGLKE